MNKNLLFDNKSKNVKEQWNLQIIINSKISKYKITT